MPRQQDTLDHQAIGRQQDLWFVHGFAPGAPFFLPAGAHIYNKLIELCREECAVAAAHDPEAARLLAQLDSANLDARMDLDVGHQSWCEFKRE